MERLFNPLYVFPLKHVRTKSKKNFEVRLKDSYSKRNDNNYIFNHSYGPYGFKNLQKKIIYGQISLHLMKFVVS